MHQAKRSLERYGWKEGKGLGKNETGIARSIKVSLKTDTAGIGFNSSEDFTSHWWTKKFNEAAKNINVEHKKQSSCSDDNEILSDIYCSCKSTCQQRKCPCKAAVIFCGTRCRCGTIRKPCKNKPIVQEPAEATASITAAESRRHHIQDGVIVSSCGTQQARLGKRKKSHRDACKKPPLLYEQFVKGTVEDSTAAVKSTNIQQPMMAATELSDSQLLEACEGRTAHKGARHGLKQSGKLKRLEEQEKKMTQSTSTID